MRHFLDYLIQLDYWIFGAIHNLFAFDFLNKLLVFLYNPGFSKVTSILIALIFFFSFYRAYNWKGLGIAITLLLQLSLVDATVSPIKEWIQRPRPEFTTLPNSVQPRLKSETSYSMPSGHSVDAFFIAVSWGLLISSLRPAVLLLAFLVCVSRVYAGLHFPSDILAGALIGAAWAFIFYYPNKLLFKISDQRSS